VNTRRLATWVVLDGKAYGPHHDLTAEQAARITNPLAWSNDPPSSSDDAEAALTVDSHSVERPEATHQPAVLGVADVVVPPRAGRGSSVEAWETFAAAHQVAIPAGADRAAIIAACEGAGLVEPQSS
jgi:hypothetical protein